VLGSGSELRLDAIVGADPGLVAALYQPIWRALFVVPHAGVSNRTFNLIADDEIVARYSQTVSNVGAQIGVNLRRDSDLRLGATVGRLDADVKIGNPGLPEIAGKQTVGLLTWRMDTSDSAVVPSRGTLAEASFTYVFDGPNITVDAADFETTRSSVNLPQLSGEANRFWMKGDRNRLFMLGGGGTSFDGDPLPVDQFALGRPFHLGAYNVGEIRGNHYAIVTAGVLREMGRMPDFIGGPVYVGAWSENGDAFDDLDDATLRSHLSGGLILETLIGPVILAGSAGFDGSWRTYIGIGRLFR